MPITCVYCGSSHAGAAEVRACWQRAQNTETTQTTQTAQDIPTTPGAPVEHTVGPAASWDSLAGPGALGRNVVIRAGTAVPGPWSGATTIAVTEAVLAQPAEVVAVLRGRAARRERTVFELHVPFPREAIPRTVESRLLHELGPRFELALDALHHLVWANSVDASSDGAAVWPWTEVAVGLGARRAGGTGDVLLDDGTPALIDAGPLTFTSATVEGAVIVPAVSLEHGRLTPLGTNEVSASAASLAPDQHAAVTHTTATARIIAPAGSGKTRVLTERARHLLTRWGLPERAVCLVAFNTRAQAEMRTRTADLPGLQVRTLNSIALAVVNGTSPFAPQPRTRRTIDEPEVRRQLDRLVQTPKRRNTDPLAPWVDALSQARLGLLDPAQVEDSYDGDVDGLVDVLPRYRAALAAEGLLDFDEQIVAAIELLLTDPTARQRAQLACRVMLVDEFQDLTAAHVLLVRLLAGPPLGLFGVGDDDQTIYGYQGADPAWLIEFAGLFPGAGDHPLEVNYRCPAGIVTAADRLLRRNRRRVPKLIRAAQSGDGWHHVAAQHTLPATIDAVRDALDGTRIPADVAVLTRVNALLAPVQVGLADAGIAVAGGVGKEFLNRTAVRATLAWLRLAAGDWNAAHLGEALRRPSRPLHPNVVNWVCEAKSPAALDRLVTRLRTPRDAQRVEEFGADIARMRAIVEGRATTATVLSLLLYEIGLAGAVSTLDLNRQGMNRGAQHDDLTALEQLAHLQPDPSTFPAWLAAALDVPRTPTGVTLATVHRVKGQEWPIVVVHEASDAQFPHRLAQDVEEERRLFHVAITRASERVIVVCPAGAPSPFVAEAGSEPGDEPALTLPAQTRAGAAPPPPPQSDPLADDAAALLDALKAWRRVAAAGKPAYTVFSDATLEAIARAKPRDLNGLARIKGLGPVKLERFGDAVLTVVEDQLG